MAWINGCPPPWQIYSGNSCELIAQTSQSATGKEICSCNARQGASITHFLQPQQKYLDLLNWEQISCNPQAELKSIHVFYSINLANLFFCYFFYFSTVTFFPVTFFPTSPLLLSFLLLFFLLLFFLLLFFRYFFSCYFLSYNHAVMVWRRIGVVPLWWPMSSTHCKCQYQSKHLFIDSLSTMTLSKNLVVI